jgi:hypothetical protein
VIYMIRGLKSTKQPKTRQRAQELVERCPPRRLLIQ